MSNLKKQHDILRLLSDIDLNKYINISGINFFGIVGALKFESVQELCSIWNEEKREYKIAEAIEVLKNFFLDFSEDMVKNNQNNQANT